MGNFYDQWLGFWETTQEEQRKARKVIHEEELEWLETPQDYRIALLCAPETGFRTWGSESMVAEIPPGCHTGKHVHGEEGIFIVEGQGFSLVRLAGEQGPGRRYNWSKGSTVWIPFGAEHQHFNTGQETARYFSLTALHLEKWLGCARLRQLEEKGSSLAIPDVPLSENGMDSKNRRIHLGWEEAGAHGPMGKWSRHSTVISFMNEKQGFKNFEIQISGILSKKPGETLGGKHAHMEAMLYCVQGEGYSIVDGEKVPWKKGTCFHVQGPQTFHEHICQGTEPAMLLRCAPGIRMNFGHYCILEGFPYLRFTPEGELLHEIREVNKDEAHMRLGA